MSDENYDEHQMALYYGELLKTISETAPELYDAMKVKDRNKILEILTDHIFANLFTFGKINILLGKNADRLNQEEIDKFRKELFEIIK